MVDGHTYVPETSEQGAYVAEVCFELMEREEFYGAMVIIHEDREEFIGCINSDALGGGVCAFLARCYQQGC